MKRLKGIFKPPFKADSMNMYIFDSENQMVVELRGYGLIQYQDEADEIIKDLAKFVADAMNEKWERSTNL